MEESKKPLLIVGSTEDEALIGSILARTQESKSLIALKNNTFEEDLVDLPIALPVKHDVKIVDDTRRFRRAGNIEGDRFYDILRYGRKEGKVRVMSKGPAGKVVYSYETKIDERTQKPYQSAIPGSQRFIRNTSKPSKSWVARQKALDEARLAAMPSSIQNISNQ